MHSYFREDWEDSLHVVYPGREVIEVREQVRLTSYSHGGG